MVFQCINIRQVPREVLKTAAFGLGFQHLPRDLANVNAWKNMFDPYNEGTQERPQSRNKPFMSYARRDEEPTMTIHNNTVAITDIKTKKTCNREVALGWST